MFADKKTRKNGETGMESPGSLRRARQKGTFGKEGCCGPPEASDYEWRAHQGLFKVSRRSLTKSISRVFPQNPLRRADTRSPLPSSAKDRPKSGGPPRWQTWAAAQAHWRFLLCSSECASALGNRTLAYRRLELSVCDRNDYIT